MIDDNNLASAGCTHNDRCSPLSHHDGCEVQKRGNQRSVHLETGTGTQAMVATGAVSKGNVAAYLATAVQRVSLYTSSM